MLASLTFLKYLLTLYFITGPCNDSRSLIFDFLSFSHDRSYPRQNYSSESKTL